MFNEHSKNPSIAKIGLSAPKGEVRKQKSSAQRFYQPKTRLSFRC